MTRHEEAYTAKGSGRCELSDFISHSVAMTANLAVATFVVFFGYGGASAAQIKTYDIQVEPGLRSIHWMNPQKLAVMAIVQAGQDEKPILGFNRVRKLAVIDLDSQHVTWGDTFTGRLCVNGDAIAYFTSEEISARDGRKQRFWLFEGTLGSMSKREVRREELNDSALDFHYTCKRIADLPAEPINARGKRLKRLRPEHGFVEIEALDPLGPVYPVRFYPADPTRPATPIDALRGADIDLWWTWFPFKHAYWIEHVVHHDPILPPGNYRSWWLHPDGRVSVAAEFNLAQTFRGRRSWTPTIPVRDGFLALEERGRPSRILGDIRDAGIYRFDPTGKHKKLTAGQVGSWAVSPDGCNLAVGIDDKRQRSNRYILKVLDVCERH